MGILCVGLLQGRRRGRRWQEGGKKVNEGEREGRGKLKVKVMLLEQIMYKYKCINVVSFICICSSKQWTKKLHK